MANNSGCHAPICMQRSTQRKCVFFILFLLFVKYVSTSSNWDSTWGIRWWVACEGDKPWHASEGGRESQASRSCNAESHTQIESNWIHPLCIACRVWQHCDHIAGGEGNVRSSLLARPKDTNTTRIDKKKYLKQQKREIKTYPIPHWEKEVRKERRKA